MVLLAARFSPPAGSAQTTPQKPADTQPDVIRVNTELVQTDVTVFDKQGHFVDGLRSEQFALKIDSKPAAISFFERVTSGKLSLDQGPVSSSSANPRDSTSPST